MGATKLLTIPKYRVPITLHNQEYDPQKAPGIYARHKSACTPSKISIWLIDTFTIKWLRPQTGEGKRKRPQAEHKSHAKNLALVLLASIRNGGHDVTTTSWANRYELGPDNAVNHIINGHEIHETHIQLVYILGIRQ